MSSNFIACFNFIAVKRSRETPGALGTRVKISPWE